MSIWQDRSYNLYAYAGDDPANAADPSGLATEWINVLGRGLSFADYSFLSEPILPPIVFIDIDLGDIGTEPEPGAASITNGMNAISHKTRIGAGVNILGQYGRMAGMLFGSARLLTVLGRANMITGGAFALYDAASIGYCACSKGG